MNKQWQQLPADLQLSDERIAKLTLKQMEDYFVAAEHVGVLDDFSQLFWEAMGRINASKPSLQECVYLLEERKRAIGRRYDKLRGPDYESWLPDYKSWLYDYQRNRLAAKYNELEYQIRWLVEQYKLDRKTKEYFLEVK